MDSFVRRLIGVVKVEVRNGLVHVDGVSTEPIMRAFFKIWNTSKIANNMFTKVDKSSFAFNQFFVPDLVYALRQMIEEKPRGLNIRSTQKVLDLLITNTWFSRSLAPIQPFLKRENLKRFNLEPLPHQVKFFDDLEDSIQRFMLKGYLLASAAGSGKTMVSLYVGEMIESDVNIIIAPKNSIDLVWKKTFQTAYKKTPFNWVSTESVEVPSGKRNYAFHYERLDDALEFVKKHRFIKPLLWLDESHNLNEANSIRSKIYLELNEKLGSSLNIWASGTPIKAMGREVIPLLKAIDKFFDEDAEERFTQIFGKTSSRALDILNNRLGMMMHRTTKAEVRTQTPIKKEIKVKIPNGEVYTLDNVREVLKKFVAERIEYYQKHMKEYEAVYQTALNFFEKTIKTQTDKQNYNKYKSYISQIRKGYDPAVMKEMAMYCNHFELKTIVPVLPQYMKEPFKDARTVIKYYLLKVNGEALGRVFGKMREQCIVDMIPYCGLPDLIDESEKKVVIFSTYVNAIKQADIYLRKEGYHPLMVFGETNKDLNGIVNRFDKDEDLNPLLATFASLSTAVPLTMANTCIMLNVPFREYIYNQAMSRVDRLGQTSQVYLFDLFLDTGDKTNISTRSADILEWCKQQVEQIVGKSLDIEDTDSVALECYQIPENWILESKDTVVIKW